MSPVRHRPRWLLLQYAADVGRAETRNVGLFVYDGVDMAARFLAVEDGIFDLALVPGWIRQPQVYAGWVAYWLKNVQACTADGLTAEVLVRSSNYTLLPAGCILSGSASSVDEVADEQFAKLVVPDSRYPAVNDADPDLVDVTVGSPEQLHAQAQWFLRHDLIHVDPSDDQVYLTQAGIEATTSLLAYLCSRTGSDAAANTLARDIADHNRRIISHRN